MCSEVKMSVPIKFIFHAYSTWGSRAQMVSLSVHICTWLSDGLCIPLSYTHAHFNTPTQQQLSQAGSTAITDTLLTCFLYPATEFLVADWYILVEYYSAKYIYIYQFICCQWAPVRLCCSTRKVVHVGNRPDVWSTTFMYAVRICMINIMTEMTMQDKSSGLLFWPWSKMKKTLSGYKWGKEQNWVHWVRHSKPASWSFYFVLCTHNDHAHTSCNAPTRTHFTGVTQKCLKQKILKRMHTQLDNTPAGNHGKKRKTFLRCFVSVARWHTEQATSLTINCCWIFVQEDSQSESMWKVDLATECTWTLTFCVKNLFNFFIWMHFSFLCCKKKYQGWHSLYAAQRSATSSQRSATSSQRSATSSQRSATSSTNLIFLKKERKQPNIHKIKTSLYILRLQNNWGWSNGFQLILVLVYTRELLKTAEKVSTICNLQY